MSRSNPVSLHTCSFSEEGFKPVSLIPLLCKCPNSNLSLFKPNYRLVHTINIDPIAVTPAHYSVLTRSPISSGIDLRDFALIFARADANMFTAQSIEKNLHDKLVCLFFDTAIDLMMS